VVGCLGTEIPRLRRGKYFDRGTRKVWSQIANIAHRQHRGAEEGAHHFAAVLGSKYSQLPRLLLGPEKQRQVQHGIAVVAAGVNSSVPVMPAPDSSAFWGSSTAAKKSSSSSARCVESAWMNSPALRG